MESKGSLLCSQGPANGPYPEPDAASPHLPILFVHFLLPKLFQIYLPSLRPYVTFHNKLLFNSKELLALAPPASWDTTPCQQSRNCELIIYNVVIHF